MVLRNTDWDSFKQMISSHAKAATGGGYIFRGHKNSDWTLTTSFARENVEKKFSHDRYVKFILPFINDHIETVSDKKFNIADPREFASLVSNLQHYGFPTPLMDWSLSPYIAAFFAFSEVHSENPESDHCSIYGFNYQEWMKDWRQENTFEAPNNHVSVVVSKSLRNVRVLKQQGIISLYSNVDDVESHITTSEKIKNKVYLEKFNFSVKERPYVMRDLEIMGITALSLFDGEEGFCKFLKESAFRRNTVGMTPLEKLQLSQASQKSQTKQS